MSEAIGPPTTAVTVSGAGFGAFEGVDIYFDTTDEALVTTNANGNFSGISFQVPASALPGSHEISAVGRHSGLGAQATFTVSTPWSEFHYSNLRKGSNPFENVLSAGNVASIDEDWRASIGGGGSSSPAVVNGVVYVGSQLDDVYALNSSTGAQLWSFATGGAVQSSPAVANGIVYVGSNDDNVYALDSSTGAKLWSFATGGAVQSSPAVANGVVYVGSDDCNVYALNASTGAKLWSYLAPTGTDGCEITSSPAVANGLVYVGSTDDNVWVLDASTGAQVGHYNASGPIDSSPALARGMVYFGSEDGHIYAFNATLTGNLAWSFTASAGVDESPAVVNGVVYVDADNQQIYALNASTGAELWSSTSSPCCASTSPAVANGVVYVGSYTYVYALNASTGAELWRFNTGSEASSAAITNGGVYVDGSYLYAFDLAGGTASTVSARWTRTRSFTATRSLTVNTVPRGGVENVSCRGRGCPFAQKTLTNRGRVALARLFSGARFRPGTRIRVSISAPQRREEVVIFVIRTRAKPLELQGCLARPRGAITRGCA